MKRWSLLAISFSVVVVLLYGTFASTVLGVTDVTIRGNLYKVPAPGNNLSPLVSKQVSINCGGIVKTATTDSNGLYAVTFSEAGCSSFSTVSAQSSFNNSLITRQVTVSSENRATINLFF